MIIPEQMRNPLIIYLKSGQYYTEDKDRYLKTITDECYFISNFQYGILIISEKNGEKSIQAYETQFPLDYIFIENEILEVHEGTKHKPWMFDKSGVLLQKAWSFWFTMEDKDILKEYGITSQAEIDEMEKINSEGAWSRKRNRK